MSRQIPFALKTMLVASAGFIASPTIAEVNEFDEFEPIIEINATDGDVGFHTLLDGESWRAASIFSPTVKRLLQTRASNDLRQQGLTEIFFESSEPLCWNDPEADPDDEVVTLEQFLQRFAEGNYFAFGRDRDLELIRARGEFTHTIPAAPAVEIDHSLDGGIGSVTINWDVGTDLGNCAYPAGLIDDPASVEVVRWEIVIEPEDEELPEGVVFAKFTAQVLGDVRSFEIPGEYLQPFVDAGATVFKGEVGAKEESGNQTFTEVEFELGAEEEEE